MPTEHHTHELDLWVNTDGDVVGAPILLSPAEAMKLQETGQVTLTLARHWDEDDGDDHGDVL